jgi:hypothetical protein
MPVVSLVSLPCQPAAKKMLPPRSCSARLSCRSPEVLYEHQVASHLVTLRVKDVTAIRRDCETHAGRGPQVCEICSGPRGKVEELKALTRCVDADAVDTPGHNGELAASNRLDDFRFLPSIDRHLLDLGTALSLLVVNRPPVG